MQNRTLKIFSACLVLFQISLRAETLADLLPAVLTNAAGEEVPLESLQGKIVGLYFSAEWCPPCRAFTPSLVKFRDDNKEKFEVVFVSSDRSAADMAKYMGNYKMNFSAVPFDAPQRAALGSHFGVRGIPSLIILDDKGNLISRDGRGDLSRDAAKALADWQAKAGG